MVAGLDVLGATASALQIVGMICSLGNRILDKPKDTKSVRSIAVDAKSYIRHLEHWSLTITGDAKEACEDLHQQLHSLVDEVHGHKGKKALEKAKTCLKLYKPEFREKFADALDKFKFRMCVESRRSVADMEDKLTGMTKSMEELRITSKTLETLPGMEEGVAKVEERMKELSKAISDLTSAVANVQSALHRLEATSVGKAQVEEMIRTDGDVTRESIRRFARSVSETVEKVHERQMLNESIIKITSEILPRSSNLVWYDGSTSNPTFKIWSLDEPRDESKGSAPQANFAGLELSSISLETTYDELHEKRYIADDLEEDVREKKQRRVSDVSPYVNLVRRRDSLEELREFVPPRFEEQFRNELPREAQLEALRVARSLSQEYRYVVLDQILQQKAHTLPKLHQLEDMERAMLAIHSNKLEARLEFVIQNVVNEVDFPYRLCVAVEEYFPQSAFANRVLILKEWNKNLGAYSTFAELIDTGVALFRSHKWTSHPLSLQSQAVE